MKEWQVVLYCLVIPFASQPIKFITSPLRGSVINWIGQWHCGNKHTVSIAEAIHVPYRPQQISKRCQLQKEYMKGYKSEKFSVLCQYKVIPQIWCQYLARRQKKVGKNLTCIMSRQIHIWIFKSICRKMTKKSPENEILAKGNNSCKSRSSATKVELDLYYVNTNSYMKFQVNMSKDDKEKSGKRNFSKGQ